MQNVTKHTHFGGNFGLDKGEVLSGESDGLNGNGVGQADIYQDGGG